MDTIIKYEYIPRGVCSTKIEYEINNDIIENITITNGCPGNTLGVAILCKGKHIDEVINLLKGIPCRTKPTSCPDQLAQGLIEYKKKYNK